MCGDGRRDERRREIEPDVPKLQDLLSAFHAHGVRYLVVSAYAVIIHAQPRFTKEHAIQDFTVKLAADANVLLSSEDLTDPEWVPHVSRFWRPGRKLCRTPQLSVVSRTYA